LVWLDFAYDYSVALAARDYVFAFLYVHIKFGSGIKR
jgi:hypothetical protein